MVKIVFNLLPTWSFTIFQNFPTHIFASHHPVFGGQRIVKSRHVQRKSLDKNEKFYDNRLMHSKLRYDTSKCPSTNKHYFVVAQYLYKQFSVLVHFSCN